MVAFVELRWFGQGRAKRFAFDSSTDVAIDGRNASSAILAILFIDQNKDRPLPTKQFKLNDLLPTPSRNNRPPAPPSSSVWQRDSCSVHGTALPFRSGSTEAVCAIVVVTAESRSKATAVDVRACVRVNRHGTSHEGDMYRRPESCY
jgi:hypothetical protein